MSWQRSVRALVTALAVATVAALTVGALPASAAAGVVATPDSAQTTMGRPVEIDVTANDTTGSTDPLVVVRVTRPEHGSAEVVSDSTVSYQPDDGYVGTDDFWYVVRSGEAEGRARVSVTVAPGRPLTVTVPERWVVLLPGAVSGDATPLAELSVRVTGPNTDTTLAVEAGDDGAWSATFTPRWPGTHTVVVTEGVDDGAHTATATVEATAKYLTARSGPLTRSDVAYSYRPGCPVAPAQLRNLTITYWDWRGQPRLGVLVVNRRALKDLRYVFRVAFRTRFPIRSVTPAEQFYDGGRRTSTQSDKRAMTADNTSAFNCRRVTGSHYRRSPHSFGTSIDINPRENPYVTHRRVYPRHARTYLKRSNVRKGMLVRSSPVVKALERRGWAWGTRYHYPDYQHFDM